MEFLIEYGYIGVFIASFLAATILPFSSEVVLTGVLLAGSSYWPCMIAATLGNFLGGMSCYWLGMLGKVEWIENTSNWMPGSCKRYRIGSRGKAPGWASSSSCPALATLSQWRWVSSAPTSGSSPSPCSWAKPSAIGCGWSSFIRCRGGYKLPVFMGCG